MPAAEPAPAAALGGVWFDGLARVSERPPRGMATVKADLASDALRGVVEATVGAPPPDRLRFAEGEGGRAAWMAPDEFLLIVPRERLAEALRDLSAALEGEHALVADVSDARAAFSVSGAAARDVLAKLTPVDLAPAAFGPGAWRRTRLAQVAAAIACLEPARFEVLVHRSQALYAFEALRAAADPSAPVGLHGWEA